MSALAMFLMEGNRQEFCRIYYRGVIVLSGLPGPNRHVT
jgi:hypothetical protein